MAEGRVLVGTAVAFVLTLVLVRVLAPLARRIGLVDSPGAIKVHAEPVPLVGGLALFMASVAGLVVLEIALTPFRAFLLAGAALVVVGVLDDFHELSSRARFAVQIAAGLLACLWGEVRLVDMGTLRFDGTVTALGGLEVPITVFCVVGVINALNMVDGLDGLASGLAAIALGALATAAASAGHAADARVLAVILAGTMAFWLVNTRAPGRRSPQAFLGDAGSLFLGFVISWFVVSLSQGAERAFAPVQALWCVAIPLFDTVRLLVWRAAQGRSPFAGDQEHLHHVLRRAGLGHGATVAAILVAAALLAAGGLALPALGVSELAAFLAFMATFCVYSLALGFIGWRGTVFGRPLDARVGPADRRAGASRRRAERRGEERRTRPDRRQPPDS